MPPIINVGPHRGFTIYHDPLKKCRKCGDVGHLVINFPHTACFKCGGKGHRDAKCKGAQKYNLCEE